jgi:membrane fusion protein (multidrug efflux system)
MKMYLRIWIAVIGVLFILGGVGAIKGLQIKELVAQSDSFVPPPQTVTVAMAAMTRWEKTLSAVGSLEAVQGMMVSAEMPGKIDRIAFKAGARVEAGELLLLQDISEERAGLRAAESRARLAAKDLQRAELLKNENVVTEALLDEKEAEYEQAIAEKQRIQAVIAKKTIRAPFAGRLGIRLVNSGQFLESGQPIVSLQSMDPIFVNFKLPQRNIRYLEAGLGVRAYSSEREDDYVSGRITALNPDVDTGTRNIQVQATLANSEEQLRPGMFIRVSILLPEPEPVLTIPATAVLHAPYSDSVFVVEDGAAAASDQAPPTLRQTFVRLGEKRGDFVAVRDGLRPGETVVSTGVFQLRNGMPVAIDNRLAPDFELTPRPDNA